MKIVFPTLLIDVTSEQKERFRSIGVTVYDDKPVNEAELIERIGNAEVVTSDGDFTATVLNAAKQLKYVIYPVSGVDRKDFDLINKRDITILNCPNYNANAVAEFAITLMLSLRRHIIEASAFLKAGNWGQRHVLGSEAEGYQLGLMGYGNIGKRIERVAMALGMNVVVYNSKSTEEDLHKLLRESDVVCLCLPLNDDTYHIINAERLKLMKPTALLINVGRGAVIDQPALIAALKDSTIGGAGLDVFENEPTGRKEATPEIMDLANLPNVLATSHIAFNTREGNNKCGEDLWDNVQSILAGTPINVVN
jgi:D-3-phosphoglycerate dehydrogenase